MTLGMLTIIQSRSNPPLEDYFTLQELRCYNLPFGVVGFVSHVLTYWTILWIWYGRRPLWPYHEIILTKPDFVANGIGFLLCIAMSAITLTHCRNTWQLFVIAVWKLCTSVLNALMVVCVAWLTVRTSDGAMTMQRQRKRTAWLLILYIPGMLAGMSGLLNLVAKTIHNSRQVFLLTIGFFTVAIVSPLISAIVVMVIQWSIGNVAVKGCGATFFLFITLSVFYCDFCLGFMFGDILDAPSEKRPKTAFYWLYFVAERLPMFTW